jgi:hypothetical protein
VLLFLVVIPTGSAMADSGKDRVLVLPLGGSVPGAADGAERLTRVVARAAGLTGGDVVLGHATFADAATAVGCSEETAPCLEQLAVALNADQVVIGRIEPGADGGITIELKLFAEGEVRERSIPLPAGDMGSYIAGLARQAPPLFVPGGEPPPEQGPDPVEPSPDPNLGSSLGSESGRGETPPPPEGFGARVGAVPWMVAGAGAVLAGAGGAFLYLAKDRQDQVDSAEPSMVSDFEQLVELEDEGERYTKIGNGLAIAGGAVFAAGIALVVWRGMSGDSPSEPPATVSFGPLPGGGAAAALTWSLP